MSIKSIGSLDPGHERSVSFAVRAGTGAGDALAFSMGHSTGVTQHAIDSTGEE